MMTYQTVRTEILQTARQAIENGLNGHRPQNPATENIPDVLRKNGACFVTLEIDGQLRGCIGSLEARQALIKDIAHNAYAAAFSDPRFPPLTRQEFEQIDIHVSILTPAVEIDFEDEEDLLKKIRPQIDGLIIEDNGRRGTFLPSVWDSLPEAPDFLRHLKMKAGLPPDYWSPTVRVFRYTTEMIE